MNNKIVKILGLLAVVIMSGCTATGKYTTPLTQTNNIIKEDKAAIVFFRASSFGGAISSPLVEITNGDGDNSLVGIIGPKEKMIKYVEPGQHTFMVVGESGDFMKANVEAGKVYYSVIRPRIGFWKSRFSLTPFKVNSEHADFNINSSSLKKLLKECSYTQPSDGAFTWHRGKELELKDLYKEYYPTWENKAAAKKEAATLLSIDGLAQEL